MAAISDFMLSPMQSTIRRIKVGDYFVVLNPTLCCLLLDILMAPVVLNPRQYCLQLDNSTILKGTRYCPPSQTQLWDFDFLGVLEEDTSSYFTELADQPMSILILWLEVPLQHPKPVNFPCLHSRSTWLWEPQTLFSWMYYSLCCCCYCVS